MALEYSFSTCQDLFSRCPDLSNVDYDPNYMSSYQYFTFLSHYSHHIEEESRRETFQEATFRFLNYVIKQCQKYDYSLTSEEVRELYEGIITFEVLPAMRLFWSAGPAVEKDAVAAYNCGYTPVDSLKAFDETLYMSMCSTGVGFSVEGIETDKLPVVHGSWNPGPCLEVKDSKIGWAESLRSLVTLLYEGYLPTWNLSKIRPKGARLKTFGGFASGPDPLDKLFQYVTDTFLNASKYGPRRLRCIELHDIMCMIGAVVVAGGVRRSALISLSDLEDTEIRDAKRGKWYETHPHRSLSNNSAVYEDGVDDKTFWNEWEALKTSGSGERGIFGRSAARRKIERLGSHRRDPSYRWGGNPCLEIILRPRELCNLSEIIVRPTDTAASLLKKARLATILGTIQSTITDFRYLSSDWKNNCEDERLLGVSMTGVGDHQMLFDTSPEVAQLLDTQRELCIEINKDWATRLHIKPSAGITCMKPSGTTSQLTNTASGMHPRYAPYYIRRQRLHDNDHLAQWMVEKGVPYDKDPMQADTLVFSFPVASPNRNWYNSNLSASRHADIWMQYQNHWTEHKPSVTIQVRQEEWDSMGKWVFKNLDNISGIAFLQHGDDAGQDVSWKNLLPPFEPCSQDTYLKFKADFPSIDWHGFKEYTDGTSPEGPIACVGGQCEL